MNETHLYRGLVKAGVVARAIPAFQRPGQEHREVGVSLACVVRLSNDKQSKYCNQDLPSKVVTLFIQMQHLLHQQIETLKTKLL